ncbi:MAG: tRNA pseudouridine(55) synthase TruB [Proteobacteria bacterium]|nr:tRNA pseudouridine(55) synthase TruB [Pseudomonadota bacterium]
MRRTVDGLLLLDKPAGPTSNAALQTVRRLFGALKAGHAGTLDPLASGLLPVLFGEATKFAAYASDAGKTYAATVRLGSATSTGDAEGEVITRQPIDLAGVDVRAVLSGFEGDIEQVPPMYSALKQAGVPLYTLARRGVVVHRPARRVQIDRLELLGQTDDALMIRVACSKGTYVRTLAEDIGVALGTVAHLGALRRTGVGPWRIEQAVTLDWIDAAGTSVARDAALLPVLSLVAHLPQIGLETALAQRFRLGQALGGRADPDGPCAVLDEAGVFLGVGEVAQATLKPRRLVSTVAP